MHRPRKHRKAAGESTTVMMTTLEDGRKEFERCRPIRARGAQVSVSEEQRAEGTGIRDDEQPHRKLAGRDGVRRGLHCGGMPHRDALIRFAHNSSAE